MTDFPDFTALRAAVGTEIGVSNWIEIDQSRIDRFAESTGDAQWIHVDPVRAAIGPYGRTIAHGFLTLALLAPIAQQVMTVRSARMAINYGLDKVRFPTPVSVGSRVRGTLILADVTDILGGVQAMRDITITAEGSTKPACVARHLVRYLN
ncbi:MaoC family dehydratase [Nocardia rhizosphaerihabitans]|uniref:Enoyl-CoA hydratase 1 n=1 Tax=Nocardia rhizosphaerihabitans TaxID=1691570 RepID=A0ABQ2KZ41_9NOCA|nr:MaoC family dehydratase [Nocardia rhizosphaerihabitans]GGN97340.1 putative enoyl-CoA hydratase 1 [Nocardia rhizosphaerihabitans]